MTQRHNTSNQSKDTLTWSDLFDYDGLNLIRRPSGVRRRYVRYAGKIAGCKDRVGNTNYIKVGYLGRKAYAHKIIYEMHYGEIPDGMTIDHIDGDGENNRLGNLRLVTTSGNAKNARLGTNNSSGVKGVGWCKRCRKWQASIKINQNPICLGYFKDFFEAVCRRKSAEVKYGFDPTHGRAR